MATIRELVIKFGFDVDEAPLKKMESSIEDLKAGFLAVSAAAAAAAASIFGIAKSTANAADAIKDTSIASGVSYEELQKLGYAAMLSGSSQEELADSLKFLARASYDARDANSEAAKTFRMLGVSAIDASGKLKRPDQILYALADAFKRLPSGVEKSAMAMSLFGRSGNKFIQMLDNGSQGIRDLGAEAIDLGIIMNDSAIKAGAEFNDNFDSLLATIKGVVNVIGSGLIPVVSDILTDMRNWIKTNRELLKTRLQNFIEILAKYLKNFWRVVTAVYFVLRQMVIQIDKVTQSVGGFTTVLKVLASLIGLFFLGRMAMAIVDAVKGFYAISKAAILAWRSVLLGPILIGAAITAAFLIVEDFIAWLDGRPSVLGFILKNKDEVIAKIESFLTKVLEYTGKFLRKITIAFLEFFGIPTDEAEAAFDSIANALKKLVIFAGPYLKRFALFMKDAIGEGIKNLLILIQALAQGFVALATNPKQAIADFARLIGETLKGAILSLVDLLRDFSNSLMTVLGFDPGSFQAAWQAFGDMVGNIVETIFGFLQDLKDSFAESFRGMINALTKLFEGDFLGFFKTLATTVFNLFIGIFMNIVSFIGGIVVEVFNGITQLIIAQATAIGEKIKGLIIDPIKNIFGNVAAKLGINFGNDSAVSQFQSVATNPFPGITPAATVSNMNNQSSNTEIKSTINVTVPPGSDANAVGEAVRKAANEEFARMLRPAARATKSNVSY